jgi:hypothetical protein
MKRLFILLSSFLPGFLVYSQQGHQFQVGMDVGGYYSPGFMFLKSSSMSADPHLTYSTTAFSGSFGGRMGLTYIAKEPAFITFGIALEIGQSSVGMDISKMDLTSGSVASYSKKLKGKVLQQSWLLQVTPHLGSYGQIPLYIESGLQLNTVTSMQETNSIVNSDFYIKNPVYILKDHYRPYTKSILAGAGLEFGFFRLGVRFTFPVDQITKSGYLPIQDGVYNNVVSYNSNYTTNYRNISGLKMTTIQFTFQIHFLALAEGRCDLGHNGFQAFPLTFRKSYFWKMSNF